MVLVVPISQADLLVSSNVGLRCTNWVPHPLVAEEVNAEPNGINQYHVVNHGGTLMVNFASIRVRRGHLHCRYSR